MRLGQAAEQRAVNALDGAHRRQIRTGVAVPAIGDERRRGTQQGVAELVQIATSCPNTLPIGLRAVFERRTRTCGRAPARHRLKRITSLERCSAAPKPSSSKARSRPASRVTSMALNRSGTAGIGRRRAWRHGCVRCCRAPCQTGVAQAERDTGEAMRAADGSDATRSEETTRPSSARCIT